MTAELLFETIGDINGDFVNEAVQTEKKNYKWVKYVIAAAACLGIGLGVVTVFDRTQSVPITVPANTTASSTSETPAEIVESSDSGMVGDYNAAIMIGGVVYWDT